MGNAKKNKRTARFERARAEPSRFLVYPINRSGTSAVKLLKKEGKGANARIRTMGLNLTKVPLYR